MGVEEEFLLVSPAGVPRAVAAAVLQHASARGAEHDGPGGGLEKEFTQQQVETSTRPCATLPELLGEVRAGRGRADTSARHAGARVVALATAPQQVEGLVIANRRSERIRAVFGQLAREQLTCGCHVHVGVESAQEGVVVIDHLRPWTPVLLALSANSPSWQGRDSGYASYRSQVWSHWPTAGTPEPFGDAASYQAVVDALLASGTILDVGMVYFDARLSARYPTVEVRVADVCLEAPDAVLLAALVRALADTAVDPRTESTGPSGALARSEVIRLAAWQAALSGVGGDLVSPLSGRPAPALEVVGQLVDHVRPALERNGDLDAVGQGVQDVFTRGNGAVRQRRWRTDGADDAGVVVRAVDLTHA